MNRILILLAVLILIAVGAVIVFVGAASKDILAPDTTDLVLERPELSTNENAFTYFDAAAKVLYWPDNSSEASRYLAGKPVDPEPIEEIITRNAEMLAWVEKGLSCRICLAPEVTGFDSLVPYVSKWRNMARAMAVKTRRDRLAGDYEEATRSCVALLRFSDLVQYDAGCLIHYLVGTAVLNIGLDETMDLVREDLLPLPQREILSDALAKLRPLDHGLIRAMKVEFLLVSNTIDDFGKGRIGLDNMVGQGGTPSSPLLRKRRVPGYLLQRNRTKARFAQVYRSAITNASLVYAEMKLGQVRETITLERNKLKMIAQPNTIGQMLYAMLTPSLERLLEKKCRAETNVAAARLLCALHAYENKNKTLPGSLDELVPTYIKAVPRDPYDGKPFRYDPGRNLVYSAGKDLEDSGGSTTLLSGDSSYSPYWKRWNAEDAVFMIKNKVVPDKSSNSE